MERKTNLRVMRDRYHITLTELGKAADMPNQYVSRAELGQITATWRLEARLSAALESIIASRKRNAEALEADYQREKGRLLQPFGGEYSEQ